MVLLDLGELQEIVCIKSDTIDECEVEVRGTKGARRYSMCVAMSQNRFDQGCARLWDVRLQYLIHELIPRQSIPLAARGRILSEGERIPIPSTKESMEWGIANAEVSLLDEVYNEFKDGRLSWVDIDGGECPFPDGPRAMICVMAINRIQRECRANGGGRCYDRIENEYAQVKLVLDAYAGKLTEGAISGDAWDSLAGSCDCARDLARAHNALIKDGRIPTDAKTIREEKMIADACKELAEGVYNYGIPQCDFGEAIKACALNTMDLAACKCGKRAWLVKKFTAFRYPGTKVVCPPY